jgi:predicted RNase H-like HicB family nuclease
MAYIVCAEEMDGRWIAHVPDLPGCFSSHKDRDVAIKGVAAAIEAYVLWCQRHGLRVSGLAGPMMVSEVIRAWTYEEEYEVSAFFASDRPPVMVEELDEFRRLLEMTRQDLLAAVEGLAPQDLAKEFTGERWPILGILRHVANADLWYLDRRGGLIRRIVVRAQGAAPHPVARARSHRSHPQAAGRAAVERHPWKNCGPTGSGFWRRMRRKSIGWAQSWRASRSGG